MPYTGKSYQWFSQTDAANRDFEFTFPYIEQSHIKVYVTVDGVSTLKAIDTDYVILPEGDTIRFVDDPAKIPAIGIDNVKLYRQTGDLFADRLVDFTDSAYLTELELETNQKNMFYLIQEAAETDDAGKVSPLAEYIRYSTTTGLWDASRTVLDTQEDTEIGGVADPSTLSSAATKGYVDNIAEFGTAGIPEYWTFTAHSSSPVDNYLLTDGVNIDAAMCVVGVNGVLQSTGIDFSITKGDPNSTLVLAAVPANSAKILVLNMGKQRFLNSAILNDNSVLEKHLAIDAVTTPKIKDDAVTADKIATAGVEADQIKDGAVTLAKIPDNTITYAKLKVLAFSSSGGATDSFLGTDKNNGNKILRVITSHDLADFTTRIGTLPINTMGTATADVSMGTNKITGVKDPTASQDAATRAWVIAQIAATDSSKIVKLSEETLAVSSRYWSWAQLLNAIDDNLYDYYEVAVMNLWAPSISGQPSSSVIYLQLNSTYAGVHTGGSFRYFSWHQSTSATSSSFNKFILRDPDSGSDNTSVHSLTGSDEHYITGSGAGQNWLNLPTHAYSSGQMVGIRLKHYHSSGVIQAGAKVILYGHI